MSPSPNGAATVSNSHLEKPSSADDIYITGIAGYFPNTRSVKELAHNLFNKVDMISDDDRRWKKTHHEVPQRSGKMHDIDKFDASFFGINYKDAHSMDPACRLLMERVFECLIDAGINPCELNNTNTGVFIGNCGTESDLVWRYEKVSTNDNGLLGCSGSMLANGISRWFGLKGPSYTIDTACSSSFTAFEHAYASIRDGNCDSALVLGANMCLAVRTTLMFSRLGVLSPEGVCKSFDKYGNGYVRSEGIVACYLQKAKDSRRVHAKVIHAKTNCDGYKHEGITYPSGQIQKQLFNAFYSECGVNPATVEYVEAHATGTPVGDPEEMLAISETFCQDRKGPLLVGSIKSNLGHSEGSSGMNALAKACITYNTGLIPPTIHLKEPRPACTCLLDGRVKVVTETTPWGRGLLALNSFGFGGANAHVLLANFSKAKVNGGLPADNIPRLVCVTGRTDSGVARILDDLECRPVDVEEIRLWHSIFERDIPGHKYRGYVLLGSTPNQSIRLCRDITSIPDVRKQSKILFKYNDLGSHWPSIIKKLSVLPAFTASIYRCSMSLKERNIDLSQLYNVDKAMQDKHSVVGSIAVCIALTDILSSIGIKPDYIMGSGIEELCSAYADGYMTAEEAIMAAHEIDLNLRSSKRLSTCLKNVLPLTNNKPKHWFSQTKDIMKLSSVEDIIMIEIGLHEEGYSNVNSISLIPLCTKNADHLKFTLSNIGRIFQMGVNLRLANLYPEVSFPVSQGTPFLSHLIEWDHFDSWSSSVNRVIKIPFGSRSIQIDIREKKYEYISGHAIDGRVIFPATGYLVLVWESLAYMLGCVHNELSVVFEEVYFHKATHIPKDGILDFTVTVTKGGGKFEISENSMSVVTGIIHLKEDDRENVCKDETYMATNFGKNCEETMTRKDFYKELNIRGYEYKGLFRGVQSCSVDGTSGQLAWKHNWVTFLDSLLQTNIVSQDTRNLYVPTRIEKLSINAFKHNQLTQGMDDKKNDKTLQFENFHNIQMSRSGGAEIRGLHVTGINRKPPKGIPVHEKYMFLSNFSKEILLIEDILRSDLQFIHENIQTYKYKCIELVDQEYETNDLKPIIENIGDVLADFPLVHTELMILSNKTIVMPPNIAVASKKISSETNNVLFIGANLLKRKDVLRDALATLKIGCFVLSRENKTPDAFEFSNEYDILTTHCVGTEYIVLIREKINTKLTKYVKIVTEDIQFSWIDKVKKELKEGQKLVLYSENEPVNGLLGLVNCLRREPGGETVHGLLIADRTAPAFNPDCKFYKEQLNKGLAINVFKDGHWGTYRHLLLEELGTIPAAHAYVNTATIGDMSSLRWWEGKYSKGQIPSDPSVCLVEVYCAPLNFRDVMVALGRVPVEAVVRGRLNQDCVQGLEYSGRTANGTRVMGFGKKCIANLVECDRSLLWPLPDEWTFEDAATVPAVYSTVYVALVLVGRMRRGETILIHAGSGGVGQAAINVALHHGLEVFTTVSSHVKRAFIKRLFPQLLESHIGNSRDTTFEQMIQRETNGRGVDLVLNSLADDILQATVKCLRQGGRFLEIGKYDITRNTQLETCFLQKEISFHSIMLEYIGETESFNMRRDLQKLILQGIESGAVRPLTYCLFEKHEVETAYRYFAAGKHIGKVVIKIREDEPCLTIAKPTTVLIDAIPRYSCDETQVYVIVGGLGGFGLELADWLVLRGARKLLMSSRRGISNGYQAFRIRAWRSYGVQIEISTADVTAESGCAEMLKMAAAMGSVKSIFNLAVILNDAVFQNQTPDTFRNSFAPKALTTIHLDKLTRTICPELKDFVIFSSVSCGRGNAGQTNYGYSNSVMERICEERKASGLPGLAIQWGAVGDVGLVADMQEENIQLEIGGTLQQRIVSCIQAMDKFLKHDSTIVSSIVVAEKRASNTGANSIINAIASILGISDLKTISKQAPLSEMGMDSVMAVEIKQTLERDYEIFLNAQEIRMLTISKLSELEAGEAPAEVSNLDPQTNNSSELVAMGLNMLVRNFGDEKLAYEPYIYFKSALSEINNKNVIFLLPGLESCANTFENLCGKLNARACVLQLGLDTEEDKLEKLVDRLHKTVKNQLCPDAPFVLLGYSFGGLPILALAAKLESEGHKGLVFCLDGSPEVIRSLAMDLISSTDDKQLQNHIIMHGLNITDPNIHNHIAQKLALIDSFEDKIKAALKMFSNELKYSKEFMISKAKVTFNRLKMILNFNALEVPVLNSPAVYVRPKKQPLKTESGEDHGLNKFFKNDVKVCCVDAVHSNIADNDECANILNQTLVQFFANNMNRNIKQGLF